MWASGQKNKNKINKYHAPGTNSYKYLVDQRPASALKLSPKLHFPPISLLLSVTKYLIQNPCNIIKNIAIIEGDGLKEFKKMDLNPL